MPDLKFMKISCGQMVLMKLKKGSEAPEYHYNLGTGQVEKKNYQCLLTILKEELNMICLLEQLDMLWHDIDEGRLPGKETSKWYAHIKAVKEEHPKP